MTNGDWIRSMTDEELADRAMNTCNNYSCEKCPMKNSRGKCLFESGRDAAVEWLESERREKWL